MFAILFDFLFIHRMSQGIVKGEELCIRYCDFLFFIEVQAAKHHGESTSTASQLSNKINKVPLLLQKLDISLYKIF